MSRLYDLNVVAQPDRSNPSATDFLSEAVLFGSGRPMLMIPYITRAPIKIEPCWSAGTAAFRPPAPCMMRCRFFEERRPSTWSAVDEKEDTASEGSSAALIAHLARRDLPAKPYRITADGSNIQNAILSLAADNNSDLIVMGGYGHSRLREFVLGGTTRGMFGRSPCRR